MTIPTPCPTLTALRLEADLSLALVRASGALEAAEQDLAAFVSREVLEARVARQRAEVARITAEHSAAKAQLARVIPSVTQTAVRVRILRTIKSDFPGLPGPRLVVEPGVYMAESNPLGALSIRTPGGLLGIKPGEFERIED